MFSLKQNKIVTVMVSMTSASILLSGCVGQGLFPDSSSSSEVQTTSTTSNSNVLAPLMTSSLASPSAILTPTLIGLTSPICTVQIYSAPNCTGSLIGAGLSDALGNFSIPTSSLSEGSYQLSAKCEDPAGSACSTTSIPYVVDITPPSISMSPPSQSKVNQTTDVNYIASYAGASSISLANSNVIPHYTGTAACNPSISSNTATTKTVTLSNCTGNGTVGISLASGTAQDAAGNSAGASPMSATFAVDNIGISSHVPSMPGGDYSSLPSTVRITFPEPINPASVSVGDFSLAGSTCTGASISSVSVSGLDVTLGLAGLNTCALLDTVAITVNHAGIQDMVGNWGTGSGTTTYRLNNVGPTSASFSVASGAVNPVPTSVGVTFNQPVNSATVSSADFAVSGTCGGVSVGAVTSTATVATVPLTGSGGCTNGQTVILTANFSGISDGSGNAGSGSSSATYTVDTVGPSVTFSLAGGVVNALPTSVVASFSSDTNMSTVSAADVSLSGTCAGVSLGAVNISGTDATINLNGTTSCTNAQTLQVNVNRGTVSDQTGNAGSGTASVAFTLDKQGPSAILSVATSTVNSLPSVITATYSTDTDMSTVTSSDFVLGGSCLTTSISSVTKSANVATVNISGTGLCIDGQTLSISAPLSGVADVVGNAGVGTPAAVLTMDTIGPGATFTQNTGSYHPLPTLVTVTFDSDTNMSTVTSADFSVAGTCVGAAIGTVSKSGLVATVNLTGTAGCGSMTALNFNLNLAGISDNVGNAGLGTVSAVYLNDDVGPLASLSVSAGNYNPLPTSVNVTLSADTDMSTVTSADFSVGGTCSGTSIGSVVKVGQVATVNINGTAACPSLSTMIFNTILNGIFDTTGNAGVGTIANTYVYDNVGPLIDLSIAAGTYNPLPNVLDVTFSSDTDMSTVSSGNFTLIGTCLGTSLSSITFSGTTASLHLSGTAGCGLLSTMILATNLVGVKDMAGNAAIGLQLATYIRGL